MILNIFKYNLFGLNINQITTNLYLANISDILYIRKVRIRIRYKIVLDHVLTSWIQIRFTGIVYPSPLLPLTGSHHFNKIIIMTIITWHHVSVLSSRRLERDQRIEGNHSLSLKGLQGTQKKFSLRGPCIALPDVKIAKSPNRFVLLYSGEFVNFIFLINEITNKKAQN